MRNRHSTLAVGLLLAGLMFAVDAWSAQAGRVQFVNGEVQLTTSAGVTHAVQKGDAINEGDTLSSAKAASAQIKMQDGGFVALRPDTQLKFDSFKFSGKEGEPENSFFSLFKGGFRAVTGLIGRVRKQDYHITTPVATIGIRGTDHETVMVLPDNPLVLAGGAAPGAYNKVNIGETSMTTDKGTIFVLPNQMGFAGGLNQMPQIQPINTNLFTVAPQPSPGANMDSGKGGDKGARDTAVVDPTTGAPTGGNTSVTVGTGNASVLPSLAPPTVVVVPTNLLTIPIVAFDNVYPNTTNLNWMTSDFNPSTTSNHFLEISYAPTYVVYDSQGLAQTYIGGTSPQTGFLLGRVAGTNGARNYEGGADAGVIAWGRWANGQQNFGSWGLQTYTLDQGNHMIVAVPVITYPQLNGVAYNFLAATRPTEATNTPSGNMWSVSGGSLIANFLSNTLTANLNLGMSNAQGSSTYMMTVNGFTAKSTFNSASSANALTLISGQNVCGTGGCAANAQVTFAGSTATHAGMVYDFTQANGVLVTGAAIYKR